MCWTIKFYIQGPTGAQSNDSGWNVLPKPGGNGNDPGFGVIPGPAPAGPSLSLADVAAALPGVIAALGGTSPLGGSGAPSGDNQLGVAIVNKNQPNLGNAVAVVGVSLGLLPPSMLPSGVATPIRVGEK